MANTRKIAVTQLPSGRSDNCIQFTITDTSDAFVFKNIIPMESTYMFSCWIKTAADTAQITVGDQTQDVGSSWTEVKIKLKLKAGNLQIVFNNSTIYYLYHPILERGNLPTKWTPNPDDTDAKIAGLQESVSKYNTKFNAIDGQISGLVEKTTIKKEDNSIISLQDAYSQFVQTENGIKSNIENITKSYDGQIKDLKTSIEANAEGVKSTVKSIENVRAETDSKIEQTSKDIKLSITEVSDKVQNLKAGGNNLLHHSEDLTYSGYSFQAGYIGGSGQGIGTAQGQQITSVTAGTAQNITSAHSLPKTSGLSQIFVDDGSDIKRMDKDAFKKSLNTMPDTRNTNENPLWYITNYPKQTVDEFKQSSSIGLSVQDVHTYVVLRTIIPWSDDSGGYPTQQVQVDSKFYTRYGESNTSWSSWQESFRPEFEFDFDAAGDPVFIQHT